MFNLEQAIGLWRLEIQRTGVNVETVAELESHLRDAITANRNQSLPDQLAFDKAAAQLGSPTQIKTEFTKNRFSEKWHHGYKTEKVIGAFGIAVYTGMVLYALFFSNVISPTNTDRILGLLALVTTIALAIASGYTWRVLPVIATKRARVAAGLASTVVGITITAVLFLCVLPVIQVTLSQLTVVVLWALLPMLVGGAALIGLEEAAERRSPLHRA